MSRTPPEATTTSHAMLGLLSIKEWTTYELAGQMERGLHRFWPRARSKVFEEPKKLVKLGLARAATERVGRRRRTLYRITPKGRRAMARWLAEPGEPPALEWDQMVKVFFAEAGTKQDLLATLAAIERWSDDQRRHHQARARSYLLGEGLFPDRAMITVLTGRFLADLDALVGQWAAHCTQVVTSWPEDIREAEPDLSSLREVAESGSCLRAPEPVPDRSGL